MEKYEHLVTVMPLMRELESLWNFPKTAEGVEGYAKGLCRLIQDQIKCDALESCRLLIETALDESEKMPSLPDMRDIYKRIGFRPKDLGPIPVLSNIEKASVINIKEK